MQFEKAAEFDVARSQASSRTKSLQKSTQEMEDQYKNILMQIAKSGSWKDPATGNPWVPEKKFLDPVKDVLQDMENELTEQQELNTGIMGNHTQSIINCNSARDALLTGEVTNLKNAMTGARSTHSTCRSNEDSTIADMESQCTTFDDIVKCDHDYDWFAAIADDNGDSGAGSLSATIGQAGRCRNGIAATSRKAAECDRNQDDFRSAWCDYQAKLKETCDSHDTCYNGATDNWNLAESTILQLEKEQKTIFRMLGRIRCYLNLLFGASDKTTPPSNDDIATCQSTSVTDTPLDVTYGVKAQRGLCYEADAVKSENTTWSSPGEDEWYNKEFGTMTLHDKLQGNSECGA